VSVISFPTPLQAMTTPELESELLGLAGHIAAAEARFLQLLGEFDERGGWVGDGIRSCARWLSWRAGMSRRTAAERLRVAHALRNLPRIAEAFAAGCPIPRSGHSPGSPGRTPRPGFAFDS
jgi:hypothetical protein